MTSPGVSSSAVDGSMLVESSLARATSYVTTNGMIQVTLCGLFATTVSVLVALAEQGGSEAGPAVYRVLIPAFSFVILTVSFNVYSWVHEQLIYLSIFGRQQPDVAKVLSFEQWLELADEHFKQRPPGRRYVRMLWHIAKFYAGIPFRMNNIYCYYFLLYVATPIFGLIHIRDNIDLTRSILLLVAVQLVSAFIGLRGMARLSIVEKSVRQKLRQEGLIA